MATDDAAEYVVRFTFWSRFQHARSSCCSAALLVTGMPQKWPTADVSRWIIDHIGGIFAARWVHRAAGVVFTGLVVSHLAVAIGGVLTRRIKPTMLLGKKDFTDAIDNLSYYAGYAETPPKFGRYDYRQKFEYWGLIFGSMIMVATGFILFFPIVDLALPAGRADSRRQGDAQLRSAVRVPHRPDLAHGRRASGAGVVPD